MLKGTLSFLICVYIQIPVQSQTANAVPSEVSAYEASILALLALLSLLSIVTVAVVLIVCRKMDKIWRNLSEKEASCGYVNHHARLSAADLSSSKWAESESTHGNSRTPTRPSSISLATNQNQEPFQTPAPLSTFSGSLRTRLPPDYEDTMSRLARHSRLLRSLSLDGQAPHASRDDNQSHYVEMSSCTISAFPSDQEADEHVYDTPRNSHVVLRSASVVQAPPSPAASKQSRIRSDPSSYAVLPPAARAQMVTHPETTAPRPGEQHWDRSGCSPRALSSGADGRPESITHQTLPYPTSSNYKHKPTVKRQPPVDI